MYLKFEQHVSYIFKNSNRLPLYLLSKKSVINKQKEKQ